MVQTYISINNNLKDAAGCICQIATTGHIVLRCSSEYTEHGSGQRWVALSVGYNYDSTSNNSRITAEWESNGVESKSHLKPNRSCNHGLTVNISQPVKIEPVDSLLNVLLGSRWAIPRRDPTSLTLSQTQPLLYSVLHSVLWHCWLGNRKGVQPVSISQQQSRVRLLYRDIRRTRHNLDNVWKICLFNPKNYQQQQQQQQQQ